MSTTVLITAAELLEMPRSGGRCELIAGEIKQMAPTGGFHGYVESTLHAILGPFVRQNGLGVLLLGDVGFILARDPDTVRAPDIAFIAQDRLEAVQFGEGYCVGPPDLAIEILSPGNTVQEIDDKVGDWLSAGARRVWIVNPKRKTVTVYRGDGHARIFSQDDELSGEDVLPGFSCRVSEIFDL